jgi:hypothetical protein
MFGFVTSVTARLSACIDSATAERIFREIRYWGLLLKHTKETSHLVRMEQRRRVLCVNTWVR